MKKLFLVFAVATFFVACNDGTSSTETTKDTTVVEAPAPAPDSLKVETHTETDSTVTMPVDSTKK